MCAWGVAFAIGVAARAYAAPRPSSIALLVQLRCARLRSADASFLSGHVHAVELVNFIIARPVHRAWINWCSRVAAACCVSA
eukprot:4482501-Alexandrium_andersonii.AAC.1